MMRRVLSFSLSVGVLLSLSACGDDRLTVRGHVRLNDAEADRVTGFEFPGDIRIDGDASTVTGACRIRSSEHDGERTYGVVVDLYGSGDGPRAVTLMARSEGRSSSVDVQLSRPNVRYSSSAECRVDVAYVDDGGSVVLTAESCELVADVGGTRATFDARLELHGCSVD